MGFARQEYWSGLPFSPPGDLPDPGLELASPALASSFLITVPPGDPSINNTLDHEPGRFFWPVTFITFLLLFSQILLICLFVYGCARSSFGDGNGTPLQYSCLENPMDGGAW